MSAHTNNTPATGQNDADAQTLSAEELRKDAQAESMTQRIIAQAISGAGPVDSAEQVAEDALRRANGDRDRAERDIVNRHLKLAAAEGFATSLGGFIVLPVTLPLNIMAFYVLAARMSAAIAHLRGHDLSRPSVQAAIAVSLAGGQAPTVIQKLGMTPTSFASKLAMGQLPASAVMIINKGIGFRLLAQASTKSLSKLGKLVPVVGGAIGAATDTYMMRGVAQSARTTFDPR